MIITFSKLLLLICFVLSSSVFASTEHRVIVRNSNDQYDEEFVHLEDLISNDSFDGKYFKIVSGKSSDAISFDEAEDIKLKAATVYYHLTKARNFFVNIIESMYVKNLSKITIRIDITNQFHEVGHFAHDNLNPQFNNAVSVSPGKGYLKYDISPWNYEIWFRPKKVIKIDEVSHKELQEINNRIVGQFHKASASGLFQYFLTQLALSIRDGNSLTWNSFEGYLTSVALSEGIFLALKGINYIASQSRSDYFMETALIPEVIYHEFSHIALSDHLKLTHSSPVNEGMVDYFAIAISGNTTIAQKIKKISMAAGKNALNKQGYNHFFETLSYANIDFVMGLLWDIKSELGPSTDMLIYDLRTRITTNSDIRNDLLRELIHSCRVNCTNPMIDRYTLLNIFKKRGF